MLLIVARIAVLPALLLLTACTGPAAETTSPAPSPTPSSAAAAAATTSAKKSLTAQGFVSKKIGELAGYECKDVIDSCTIKFSVDKIDVNPKCHQYGTPPPSGRKTLVLHVSMTTGDLGPEGSSVAPTIFNPFSLKGLRSCSRFGSCG
jgi:hypothetical protein